MKALTVAVMLLLLSLPALAQTQTICQVSGNQINCTSTSPPAIPPVVQPPQPSLSPELIRALAEKRAQEFAAAESARRAAIEKFEAELSVPDVWTEVRTGGQFHVRMLKERIYLSWIPDPNVASGNYFAMECEPRDGAIACVSHRDLVRLEWNKWRTRWDRKSCHSEGSLHLTTVSLDRIQWEVDSPDNLAQDIDFKTCAAKSGAKVSHKMFTLIPREVPKP
jgi:hypothetical protein